MDIEVKDLFPRDEEETKQIVYDEKCDKYDYLIAVTCGVIGGFTDIFLVGAPDDSVLGKWTDKQVDNTVMKFAKHMGWSPKSGNENNVKSAIGFLERNKEHKINYDQRKPVDVDYKFNIAPNTHHMMSLAHSPDIIGLFFSILNQFTSTSSFISDGQLVTIDTESFELRGGNPVAKLFCGIANWFFHLMSDIAGSSGAHGRGTGVVVPFYELFGMCKFGSFSVGNERKDLAALAQSAFNQGYDFRFGLAQAIPVVITDILIRLIWALRQRFQYHMPLKDCLPGRSHASLRMMLMIGQGTLCVIDLADAAARSGGNALNVFMRMNLVAWYRFVVLVLKEIFIRLGIASDMDLLIESYKKINEALSEYLNKLKAIDLELFEKETQRYNSFLSDVNNVTTENELKKFLLDVYDEFNIEKPWQGDFNDFMSNKTNRLVFK